jgi:hypothetical protein
MPDLCFLIRCVGNIVHSIKSRTQNVGALFFMLGRDRYGFQKNRAETRYAELLFCIGWDMRVM